MSAPSAAQAARWHAQDLAMLDQLVKLLWRLKAHQHGDSPIREAR